jgi:hypothetical protein
MSLANRSARNDDLQTADNMTLTTTPDETDLMAPPNPAPVPEADAEVNSSGITFTPAETSFLTLFGEIELFEGKRSINDALATGVEF